MTKTNHGTNNQGIMHAAYTVGGAPLCGNKNALMSAAIFDFKTKWADCQCKRCAAKVERMERNKTRNSHPAVKTVTFHPAA